MSDERYTIFVRDGAYGPGVWWHYGWRDTQTEALETVQRFIEQGDEAFYAPISKSEEIYEEWEVEVCPAA